MLFVPLHRRVGTGKLEAQFDANGETRKPVKVRRGPATVSGIVPRSSRHWETGKASGRPEPGDLSVRATL